MTTVPTFLVKGPSLALSLLSDAAAGDKVLVSVGGKHTIGVYHANLQYSYNRYISIWITLMVSQPLLSHTSRKPDAQSPTVLSRIKVSYY
jgi:hypothetical protein